MFLPMRFPEKTVFSPGIRRWNAGPVREDPLDTLNDARLLLLQRTKEGQEWKKEQEEWDRLMKFLDSH